MIGSLAIRHRCIVFGCAGFTGVVWYSFMNAPPHGLKFSNSMSAGMSFESVVCRFAVFSCSPFGV